MSAILPLAKPTRTQLCAAQHPQRLAARPRHRVGHAIAEFGMISDDDNDAA
ncbi:MAG: hypothetical protein ACR2J7_06255 [Luteimonas sp.]